MTPGPAKPRLRHTLDVSPVEHEGQRLFAVNDPLGLTHESIAVPQPVLFLMSQMDGTADAVELQIRFTQKFGTLIDEEKVREIIDDLDGRGFLDSPAFRERMDGIVKAYGSATVREASHAGQAYPADPAELRLFLDGIVPGIGSSAGVPGTIDDRPPQGLIAPHIDIERGRSQYALAYGQLAGRTPPRTVVVFGTGHFAEGNTYILSPKDFATPLGTMPVDREFCDRLVAGCSFDIRDGELAHRTEHSIEFQVLFLQHLFGTEGGIRIVPILCSSFEQGPGTPAERPVVRSFLEALDGAIRACPGEVLLIAGADLCHVGPKFGAPAPLEENDIERVRKDDMDALAAVANDGADAFHTAVSSVRNRNNICSVVSIYTLLKALGDPKGRVLGYDMALEPEGAAAVGFGSVAFGDRPG